MLENFAFEEKCSQARVSSGRGRIFATVARCGKVVLRSCQVFLAVDQESPTSWPSERDCLQRQLGTGAERCPREGRFSGDGRPWGCRMDNLPSRSLRLSLCLPARMAGRNAATR